MVKNSRKTPKLQLARARPRSPIRKKESKRVKIRRIPTLVNQLATAVVSESRVVTSILRSFPGLDQGALQSLVKMMNDGMTMPFIARYRAKEIQPINEVELRAIHRTYDDVMELEVAKVSAINSVNLPENDVNMHAFLVHQIDNAISVSEVSELVKPFKETSKKVSKLRSAIENVEAVDVAKLVKSCCSNTCKHVDLKSWFYSDIIILLSAAVFADEDCRKLARRVLRRHCAEVDSIKSHQWLAIKRSGEEKPSVFPIDASACKELIVAIYRALAPVATQIKSLNANLVMKPDSCLRTFVEGIKLAVVDHFVPAIRREWIAELNREAVSDSLDMFEVNLRNKLLQPPVAHVSGFVFGIDPGLASGCKVACIDASGAAVDTFKFSPNLTKVNTETFWRYLSQYKPSLIVVGDGTGSIETRKFLAQVAPNQLSCIVSESGASRYSVSELAMRELPNLPIEFRGCVSIARRVIDPLSEYVKIEPKHLSVGMYQHDIPPRKLEKNLADAVSNCVADVGVNLNTASEQLLSAVPGLNKGTAAAIVKYRDTNGPFRNRKQLLDVKGVGPVSWTHAVGFLQVPNSDWTPLDNTPVHPEDYPVANEVVRRHHDFHRLYSPIIPPPSTVISEDMELTVLRLLTLSNPRESIDGISVKIAKDFDIAGSGDLSSLEGRHIDGTVRTVTSFGAFLDISDAGVTSDGLLHISQYPMGASDPHYYRVNQLVRVKIMKVEEEKGGHPSRKSKLRIQLSTRF